MGRIVVAESISVDGVVEAPSGVARFERVGWADAFNGSPEGNGCQPGSSGAAGDDSCRKEE